MGICVTNLDPSLIERGIATSIPTPMVLASNLVCLVRKVRFFKQQCKSGSLFHVSIGHQTVTATAYFFGKEELAKRIQLESLEKSNGASTPAMAMVSGLHQTSFPAIDFDWETDYEYQEELIAGAYQRDDDGPSVASTLSFDYQETHSPLQWMFLVLQTPVYCSLGSLIIASKLDAADIPISSQSVSTTEASANSSSCRLAFYGPVKTITPQSSHHDHSFKGERASASKLKLYRWKQRECEIQRLIDCRPLPGQASSSPTNICYEAIGWKLYHKNATVKPFMGLKLMNEAGEAVGVIHGPFGASDKFRIKFPYGVPESAVSVGTKLFLKTKKYFFEKTKSLLQNGIEIEGNDLRAEQFSSEPKELDASNEPPADITEASRKLSTEVRSQDSKPQLPDDRQVSNPVSIPEPIPVVPVALPAQPINQTTQSPKETDNRPIDSQPTQHPAPVDLSMIGVKKKAPPQKKESPSDLTDTKQTSQSPVVPIVSSVPPQPPITFPVSSPVSPQTASVPNVARPLPPNCDTGDVRVGIIDTVKAADSGELVAVVSGCFRMEENIRLLCSRSSSRVILSSAAGERDHLSAQLLGPFAKLGKCKVQFSSPSPAFRPEDAIGGKVEIQIADPGSGSG